MSASLASILLSFTPYRVTKAGRVHTSASVPGLRTIAHGVTVQCSGLSRRLPVVVYLGFPEVQVVQRRDWTENQRRDRHGCTEMCPSSPFLLADKKTWTTTFLLRVAFLTLQKRVLFTLEEQPCLQKTERAMTQPTRTVVHVFFQLHLAA